MNSGTYSYVANDLVRAKQNDNDATEFCTARGSHFLQLSLA